jgi:hypothetical protein
MFRGYDRYVAKTDKALQKSREKARRPAPEAILGLPPRCSSSSVALEVSDPARRIAPRLLMPFRQRRRTRSAQAGSRSAPATTSHPPFAPRLLQSRSSLSSRRGSSPPAVGPGPARRSRSTCQSMRQLVILTSTRLEQPQRKDATAAAALSPPRSHRYISKRV